MLIKIISQKFVASFWVLLLMVGPVWSDTTDIYFGTEDIDAHNPNVVFILDNSGSMNAESLNDSSITRFEEMQIAFGELFDSLSDQVNVGLMQYTNPGAAVLYPVRPLDTHRSTLAAMVDNYQMATDTPIVDTLYEAYLYFAGEKMYYGASRRLHPSNDGTLCKPSYIDDDFLKPGARRVSHPDSYTGGSIYRPTECQAAFPGIGSSYNAWDGSDYNAHNYEEPDESYCMQITRLDDDGDPISWDDISRDHCSLSDEEIDIEEVRPLPERDKLPKDQASGVASYISPITSECQTSHLIFMSDGDPNGGNHSESLIKSLTGGSCSDSGLASEAVCGLEIAEHMRHHTPYKGVKLHTINFSADDEDGRNFLQKLAERGGGTFAEAEDGEDLASVINSDIVEAYLPTMTYAPPSVPASAFNRASHLDQVYFGFFQPDITPAWSGNLKKYRLVVNEDQIEIVDRNGKKIIDDDTGFIRSSARSEWSTGMDGSDVEAGGFWHQISGTSYLSRKLYTNDEHNIKPFNNTYITAEHLGASNNAERDALIEWARGNGNPNLVGDVLHSAPNVVIHGGTESEPKGTVFFGTNQGYLHAVNINNGHERFAFMPEGLLSNIKPLKDNDVDNDHYYGLDGSPTVWIEDARLEENSDTKELEYTVGDMTLFVGMRRGGRDYYALDVTNPNSPKVKWVIQGGTGDFSELGQTWSQPVKAQVNVNGTVRDVVVFAGGFDTDLDANPDVYNDHALGSAVYMVDAETGDLIWRAGRNGTGANLQTNDFRFAIPSTIQVVDTSSPLDGLADQMYVADTGGFVWRFDIHQGKSVSNGLVTGGRVARFGFNGSKKKENIRRFYAEVNVTSVVRNGESMLAISTGSGMLPEPLLTTSLNRFHMFYQPLLAPDKYSLIEPEDLEDRTSLDTSDTGKSIANDKQGWYIKLSDKGEKSLSAPVTLDNVVMFTTYSPGAAHPCSAADPGTARIYFMRLHNADPADDFNGDGIMDMEDRSVDLKTNGIPSRPTVIVVPGAMPAVYVGPEKVDQSIFQSVPGFKQVDWYEEGP